jgi:alpha-glucosidase
VHAEFLTTLRFWSDRGVDGFRIDVAHGLSKDLPAVLPSQAELDAMDTTDGQHPMWDRDAVHEIYREWRQVFDEYDPPRIAVAEAWVATAERRAKYAPRRASARRSTSTCSRPTSTPRSSATS